MGLTLALDYDGTVTADPGLWAGFIELARARGHRVAIVTMRYPDEAIDPAIAARAWRVIYTGRRAKAAHLAGRGIAIDIWIDDNPGFILADAGDASIAGDAD